MSDYIFEQPCVFHLEYNILNYILFNYVENWFWKLLFLFIIASRKRMHFLEASWWLLGFPPKKLVKTKKSSNLKKLNVDMQRIDYFPYSIYHIEQLTITLTLGRKGIIIINPLKLTSTARFVVIGWNTRRTREGY